MPAGTMHFAHSCCLLCKTCARHSAQPKKSPVLHICYFMLHPKRWSMEYVFSAQSTDNLHCRTCALSKGTMHNLFNAQCTICAMHSAHNPKKTPCPHTMCISAALAPLSLHLVAPCKSFATRYLTLLRIFLRNTTHSNISSLWYVGRSLIQFDR